MEPVTWTPDLKWKPRLQVEAESYNKWMEETLLWGGDCEIVGSEERSTKTLKEKGKTLGDNFLFVRQELPSEIENRNPFSLEVMGTRATSLRTFSGNRKGEVFFSGNVIIPTLIEMTGSDARYWAVWMSLTPMEVFSMRGGIRAAKGTVLMAGCGMGYLAEKVLEKKSVEHVHVVDTSSAILDTFGAALVEKHGDRVTLHHDDVYSIYPTLPPCDSFLFDIWSDASGWQNDRKFRQFSAAHPTAWRWGMSPS